MVLFPKRSSIARFNSVTSVTFAENNAIFRFLKQVLVTQKLKFKHFSVFRDQMFCSFTFGCNCLGYIPNPWTVLSVSVLFGLLTFPWVSTIAILVPTEVPLPLRSCLPQASSSLPAVCWTLLYDLCCYASRVSWPLQFIILVRAFTLMHRLF
jgi:hypothetical protein